MFSLLISGLYKEPESIWLSTLYSGFLTANIVVVVVVVGLPAFDLASPASGHRKSGT